MKWTSARLYKPFSPDCSASEKGLVKDHDIVYVFTSLAISGNCRLLAWQDHTEVVYTSHMNVKKVTILDHLSLYCIFFYQKMMRRAASPVALASLLYVASAAVLPFQSRGNVCVCVCMCVCVLCL
jgi:hypothetical protein